MNKELEDKLKAEISRLIDIPFTPDFSTLKGDDRYDEWLDNTANNVYRKLTPILIAEGKRQMVAWMGSPCPHTGGLEEQQMYKSDCPKCWQALKKEVE